MSMLTLVEQEGVIDRDAPTLTPRSCRPQRTARSSCSTSLLVIQTTPPASLHLLTFAGPPHPQHCTC